MSENPSPASAVRTHSHFPLPGQRILRSVLAVWCCILIYWLRGRQGALFYSLIAALQTVQPYTKNMLQVGKTRVRGTLVGAFWGTIALFAALTLIGGQFEDTLLHYLLLGIFTGIDLYSTVLLKIPESSWFSTVVFLSICVNHIGDANPWLFVLNRTLDTAIGVCVAIAVCAVHLPRLRDTETLFVSGVDYVLFREDRQLSPFTKVEINRFLQDGMHYTVSTRQTPATVRELLVGIDLTLPIIAMDGAVLYDLKTRRYLSAKKMDEGLAACVTEFLHRSHMPFTVNTVKDDLLVIFYRERGMVKDASIAEAPAEMRPAAPGAVDKGAVIAAADAPGSGSDGMGGPAPSVSCGGPVSRTALDALRRLYLKKKDSPFRNYVHADRDVTDNVLYFLVIDRKEQIDSLCEALEKEPWFPRCRAARDTFDCGAGEEILRIYAAEASRASMLKELQRRVGAEKTITFGNVAGECDILISDAGDSHLVRELKKRFEPVSLRGWKNILHL